MFHMSMMNVAEFSSECCPALLPDLEKQSRLACKKETPTDFTDGDHFQTLFVSSGSTARAVVALIENASEKHTNTHIDLHICKANRKCLRHTLTSSKTTNKGDPVLVNVSVEP